MLWSVLMDSATLTARLDAGCTRFLPHRTAGFNAASALARIAALIDYRTFSRGCHVDPRQCPIA